MSAGKFDIARDFSWVAFGCLIVVLFVVGAALLFSQFLGPVFSMGDRSSASELVVQNLSPTGLVFAVQDAAGTRFYATPGSKVTVIDTQGAGDPAPDSVRWFGLDCASSHPIASSGDLGFGSGGTITVDYSGAATFRAVRDRDSLGDSWSATGFPTCLAASAAAP